MTKKEFYITAIIVIFCYLAILFQVNLKNVMNAEAGSFADYVFNAFN